MDVFSRYSPFIQDFIYSSGWQSLRGVQNAAGDAIFNTDENVLLSASTASGKTEAAFFPILTLLDEEPSNTVGALYIAPLKALINDQFERLDALCAEAGIPVTKWHGDAAQSQKRRLLKKPSGILQITPESLESLLINKHNEIPSLFGDLRFDDLVTFIKVEYGRIGADQNITPREVIRDFIELLDLLFQNPDTTLSGLLQSDSFCYAKSEAVSDNAQGEFAEFEI